MSKIAIIGFGVMGKAAARNTLAAGHSITVTDPSPSAAEAAMQMGIGFAECVEDATASADIALLFLPGPEQIRSVVTGQGGILSRDSRPAVIVDHSTSDPQTARAIAGKTREHGVGWVDAPVLGRPSATGNWALPCGATEGALEIVRPVFDNYARAVFDMGGPGNGHAVKLLNQMMFGAINAMTAEMMATSEKLGLPPAKLFEIITASEAGTVSNLFKELGSRIKQDEYDNPTFSVKLLEKDIRLGLEMAETVNHTPELGRVVARMNEMAIQKGYGEQDTSVMWQSLLKD